jgi:tetratricopeptide (TPR) repeat protein
LRHDGRVSTRIAMLAAAVAVIAVSAIWLRDAHLVAEGQSAAAAGNYERAADLYGRVGSLSAGTLAETSRAFALLGAGQPARAAGLAEDAVRSEPRYIRAWAVLALAERRLDPARAAQAQARIRELGPPVGRAGP